MDLSFLSITPRYIAPSAWWQHVPIGHWLISEVRPERVVELGTHYGVSLFAFCEAAEALSSNTFIFAIDTWEGDEHSGQHSEDVYNRVSEHWGQFHRTRARLIRSTFDEASTYFEPSSIDMLHIDGLHTYEAVKHDLEKWLPLLKDDSLVLFHDINVRERGFGVWKFWLELKLSSEYRTAEILNGHGLGILIKGDKYRNLQESFPSIIELVTSKGELLEKLAEVTPGGSFFKTTLEIQMDQAKAEANQAKAEAEQAKAEAEQAKAEAEQAKAEAEQAKDEADQITHSLKSVQESRMWRAMAPIRAAFDTGKKVVRARL